MVYAADFKLLTPSLVFAVDTATGGLVYVGTFSGDLLALDAAGETARWQAATGNQVVAPPVVAAGTVYAVNRGGVLVALDGERAPNSGGSPLGSRSSSARR